MKVPDYYNSKLFETTMVRETNKDHLFIAYNIWANQKVMNQIRNLSFDDFTRELGGSFPSVQKTVHHLLESDWIWLNRWLDRHIVVLPEEWDISTAELTINIWNALQAQVASYFETLTAEGFHAIMHFKTRRGDPHSMPLWQTVYHTVNHGTYHRGQIANMIRMLGYKPESTDLYVFFEEQNRRNLSE